MNIEQLKAEYPLTGAAILSDFGLKQIASDIRKEFDRWGNEDGLTYDQMHGIFNVSAVMKSASHAEDGGDHYCGAWESIGVVDSIKYELEVFDEDGEEYSDVARAIEKYLN